MMFNMFVRGYRLVFETKCRGTIYFSIYLFKKFMLVVISVAFTNILIVFLIFSGKFNCNLYNIKAIFEIQSF